MPRLVNEASLVNEIAAANSAEALHHFERLLTLEANCWDVHEAMKNGHHDFVLLDVRGPQSFGAGHLPGAINLPHGRIRRINERNLSMYAADTLFVVYCGGPHCNGADRAAANLARLGRKIEKVIGGIEGSNPA